MDAYNHAEYMEAIATNLKEIAHSANHKAFAEASTINMFEGLSEHITTINFPCLVVIDDMTSRLIDNTSDNVLDNPYHQFAILLKADINDSASHRIARNKAKAIAKKVLSKMFKDKREYKNGLDNLQRAGIAFEGIGPMGDGAYGCLVTFTTVEYPGIIYNANDWING